ncbi:MAG: ABC transporter permease [Actinomycetota bacterium]|jgi:ABC-type polysaccharide/polyol phosphate export permease
MTATAVPPTTPSYDRQLAPGGTLMRSSMLIALRGLRAIRRVPATFIPAVMMPIFQAIAFSGTFYAITKIPGFPTDRSINWYLPLACCMGASFSGVGLGFATVRDLETGFFDRLRMAPTPKGAHILGPLVLSWARVVIVLGTVLVVGVILGARPVDWVLGILCLLVAGLGLASIAAGWGLGLAFVFKDMRAAALMQLTIFNALFLTDAQSPLTVMTGWLHTVAVYNPFTYILRLARQGFLAGVTWHDTWPGLLSIVVLSSLAMWFAYAKFSSLDD